MIDHHRMVDHQIHRRQRVDFLRVAAKGLHGIPHGSQIDDGTHTAGDVPDYWVSVADNDGDPATDAAHDDGTRLMSIERMGGFTATLTITPAPAPAGSTTAPVSTARAAITSSQTSFGFQYVTGSNREVTVPDSLDITIADNDAPGVLVLQSGGSTDVIEPTELVRLGSGLSSQVTEAYFKVGLGFDTNKVKGADIPKDWPDILNPKFKGQILIADTASSFAYHDFWAVMYDRYGEAFFAGLRAQSPRVYSSGTPASQGLGAGEGMVQIPTVTSLIRVIKDKGAPVDTVMLPYTTGVEIQAALTSRAKSKHPAAARLFLNFIMTVEGNRIFNDEPGSLSVFDDAGLPKEYVAPSLANQARAAQMAKLLGLP